MSIISTVYDAKVAFLFENTDLDKFYEERLLDAFDFFGVQNVFNASEILDTDERKDKYIEAITKYDKCVTLIRTNSPDKVKELLEYRKNKIVTDLGKRIENYPIFYLPSDLEYQTLNSIADANELDNHNYFITGFTGQEDENNKTLEYQANYTDKFVDARDFKMSYILALLEYIEETSVKYPTNNIYTLLSYIYSSPIPYPGGTMYLTFNHYISVPFYFVELNGKKIDTSANEVGYGPVKYMIEAETDFRVDQFYNRIDKSTCNFLENSVDGNVELDIFPIGFVMNMEQYKNKLIRIFVEKMINKLSEV